MFCEKCGNKLKENHKFCTECGQLNLEKQGSKPIIVTNTLEQKWWFRLLKVLYIILYSFLLLIIPIVWSESNSTYIGYSTTYGGRYEDTYSKAFWYSLLTLLIYIAIMRLIKITFLYIAFGQKPQWKKEFKKLF
ncbi:MAG: zinc ribbon domain-containing protein [Candidatus Cloacimonetes bacterium]|jgi:hypothetical protein|nr:zinc ribbon domain-containing protein [Candidatus Cloacimonadota bacterium]